MEIGELGKQLKEPAEIMVDKISQNIQKAEIEEWRKEYDQFKDSKMFSDFKKVLRDVNTNVSSASYSTPPNSLIYFQSIDLIVKNASGYAFLLSKKGLYFSRLFMEDRQSAEDI